MKELYICENETYAVRVGPSESPKDDSLVYQVFNKEHGVVEYEVRELGQAIFRAQVVNYNWLKGEHINQFKAYVSAQEETEAAIAAEKLGQETPAQGETVDPTDTKVKLVN